MYVPSNVVDSVILAQMIKVVGPKCFGLDRKITYMLFAFGNHKASS